jgi:hypothetical protein
LPSHARLRRILKVLTPEEEAAQREKRLAYWRAYRLKHIKKKNAYQKEYYWKNRERLLRDARDANFVQRIKRKLKKENDMKKIAFGLFLMFSVGIAKAEPLGDIIKTTLLGRVSAVSQFRNGGTKAAAVDSIILIGSYKGRSLIHIQGGFNKDTTTGENATFIYGVQVRFDPFINEKLNLPASWEFLRSLEHGPAIHYDTDKKGWYGSYQVGLGFGLNPQP